MPRVVPRPSCNRAAPTQVRFIQITFPTSAYVSLPSVYPSRRIQQISFPCLSSSNPVVDTRYPDTMSVSSATTLISPATYHRSSTAAAGPSSAHAKPNHHAHQTHHTHGHGHTAHHAKRKGSTHSTGLLGPSRRSSEGQEGRRAVTAGLSMLTLDPTSKSHRRSSDEVSSSP